MVSRKMVGIGNHMRHRTLLARSMHNKHLHTCVGVQRRSRIAKMATNGSKDVVLTSPDLDQTNSGANGSGPLGVGMTAVATAAALEVSNAVRVRGVEAPDMMNGKTLIAIRDLEDDNDRVLGDNFGEGNNNYTTMGGSNRSSQVDDVGLPLVYNKDLIQKYWEKENGALQRRWAEFLSVTVPFLSRIAALLIRGGTKALEDEASSLARDARIIMQRLGPTYVKLGQVLSVRPDILPQAALDELAILQAGVEPFDTVTAKQVIEKELNNPIESIFEWMSDEPVAAASLAQVYKAVVVIKRNDQDGSIVEERKEVAVKVQRPQCLETVSKDLYVLRRAAEVYQGLIERFAPQQRTNYVALLNEWAIGFYTELDFTNEARNQQKLKYLLSKEGMDDVYVPEVYEEFSTRRIMVSEWINGRKLSDCTPSEINSLIGIGQECFLLQLLQIGLFHADPHPGNLMKIEGQHEDADGKIALLDFGLVASVGQDEMDTMVSSIIHLANKDFDRLVDDFIQLEILPTDCNRSIVVPLMEKSLGPYIKGGGAKKYEEELKKLYGFDGTPANAVGGFQMMTQDMLTVLNDIPFSIPPYFALLARAVVTLEGLALSGNPSYQLIMEAYPWIARKLLKENRPASQKALEGILYGGGGGEFRGQRLSTILNSAMGAVATDSTAFIDFDSIPEDGISLSDSISYVLSPKANSLRLILEDEFERILDVVARRTVRQTFSGLLRALPQPPSFLVTMLPRPENIPIPIILPRIQEGKENGFMDENSLLANTRPPESSSMSSFSVLERIDITSGGPPVSTFATPSAIVESGFPELNREEELYLLSMEDAFSVIFGDEINIESLLSPNKIINYIFQSIGLDMPAQIGNDETVDSRANEVWEAIGGLSNDELSQLQQSIAKVSNGVLRMLFSRMQSALL